MLVPTMVVAMQPLHRLRRKVIGLDHPSDMVMDDELGEPDIDGGVIHQRALALSMSV